MSYIRIMARGSGAFPVDMLRFLQAWPATSEDAARLHSSISDATLLMGGERREVMLETDSRYTNAGVPYSHILARFESFGWSAELVDAGLVPQQREPIADVAMARPVPHLEGARRLAAQQAAKLGDEGACGFCGRTSSSPQYDGDYCAHCLRGNVSGVMGVDASIRAEQREQANPHQGAEDETAVDRMIADEVKDDGTPLNPDFLTRATQQRGRGG
jgi:hypothetical protein